MIPGTGKVSIKKILAATLAALSLLAWLPFTLGNTQPVKAQNYSTPTPSSNRKASITVDYTLYEWWLINWSDNQIKCQVFVEKEGQPVGADIRFHCGQTILNQWNKSIPCVHSGGDHKHECSGMYMYLANTTPSKRKVNIEIPEPQVWLSLINCDPQPPENRCTRLPSLALTGEESLPNETVIRIQGTINGQDFSCAGNQCSLPLQPTGSQGQTIEFWADSSYGDTSHKYSARVRVVPWGDFTAPEGEVKDTSLWYVDILSTQWRGDPPPSCSDTWNVFPEVGGPPTWLQTPPDIKGLYSSDPYYYLAGMLIHNGAVDASACPNRGMDGPYTANTCGVEAAAPRVMEWQNRFDTEILKVSNDTGVPAQLLKNIFGRESQFWPGIYNNYMETGLGQMTENGADAVLLWNPDFYDRFCPLVLNKNVCALGFGNLKDEVKTTLRAALVKSLNATCVDCPVGINLKQANFSVRIFAESMLANCEQTGRVVRAVTGNKPGDVSSYADLWRFTLVNYNAGPGCLMDAAERTLEDGAPLDWEHLRAYFAPACQKAVDYVDDISRPVGPDITPTPWLDPETSSSVQATPEPVNEEQPPEEPIEEPLETPEE